MWASTPTMEFDGAYGFALGFHFSRLPIATPQALCASSPERGALGAAGFCLPAQSCYRKNTRTLSAAMQKPVRSAISAAGSA